MCKNGLKPQAGDPKLVTSGLSSLSLGSAEGGQDDRNLSGHPTVPAGRSITSTTEHWFGSKCWAEPRRSPSTWTASHADSWTWSPDCPVKTSGPRVLQRSTVQTQPKVPPGFVRGGAQLSFWSWPSHWGFLPVKNGCVLSMVTALMICDSLHISHLNVFKWLI